MDLRDRRAHRRYRRAARRAFAQVTFYREQCAAAGRLLEEPQPTPVAQLPQPPHTLCPYARPWRPDREPSLWTPTLRALARTMRLAGCRDRRPVLEVRDALLDHTRLPARWAGVGGARYAVLLSPTATVASTAHRRALNREAFTVAERAGAGWIVGGAAELTDLPEAASPLVDRVVRCTVAELAADSSTEDGGGDHHRPTLLYEPMLGYLGARPPGCDHFHLDTPRVYARERDGAVTFSFPGSRRPVLLDVVPAGADQVSLSRCLRRRTPVLQARRG